MFVFKPAGTLANVLFPPLLLVVCYCFTPRRCGGSPASSAGEGRTFVFLWCTVVSCCWECWWLICVCRYVSYMSTVRVPSYRKRNVLLDGGVVSNGWSVKLFCVRVLIFML